MICRTLPTKIEPGYRAYNGHIFTELEARAYNKALAYAEEYPTEQNKNYAHRLFLSICHTDKKGKWKQKGDH